MPETNDPKPDANPEASKPDEPRAEGDLTRAYERIKSAEQDLARLDRLVSGMERGGEASSASPATASAAAKGDAAEKPTTPQAEIRPDSPKRTRPMLRAVVGLLLAIGVLGAAFASHYRDEARAIMARWAPPVSSPPVRAAETQAPAPPPPVRLAAADEQVPVPAPKAADSNPPAAAPAPDPKSAETAQTLKTITDQLAGISDKLEQLKSSHEQTLREQADAIRQLKAAQAKDASENARLAAQVQALQTQLATPSAAAAPAPSPAVAKPAVRSVVRASEPAPRPHMQAAAPPRRPRPPREPWMPPPRPYVIDPYDDPYW